ncbi:MAG: hypothetical protein CM1200mP6_00200 [Anaerolineaceae bacterium]|nr:MAG: hypothetical protein CM1200mP6_00200 [Anaerolineaceae bacterium]
MIWVGDVLDRRFGIVAAVLLAVDLRFIVESGSVSTESMLTILLMLSIWLYVVAIQTDNIRMWILVGVSTGITTLTRGIVQLLPLIFLLHLFLFKGKECEYGVLGWLGIGICSSCHTMDSAKLGAVWESQNL